MNPDKIIDTVCKVLELDKDVLTTRITSKNNPLNKPLSQSRKYCDGRFIIVYLIRKQHDKDFTYKDIAYLLGYFRKRTNEGDHEATRYCDFIAGELLRIKDKKFTEKVLKCQEAINGK